MNNNDKIPARKIISQILSVMKEQRYAEYTIYRYQLCYNRLLEFMEQKGQEFYNSGIGIEYIHAQFGITIEGFFGTHPPEFRETTRALQVLWDYTEYGKVVIKLRPKHKPFECPDGFKPAIELLKDDYIKRGLAERTHRTRMHIIKKFVIFISDANVSFPEQICANNIQKFISSYSSCSTRYIATIVSVLKTFLGLLFMEKLVEFDLRACLPHVRIMRNAFLPSSWKVGNVKKMLDSIDRNNPLGKRDYAIILLVTRLGLRVSDIRNLKLENLNWTRKIIKITMVKTKRPLELPLLQDIGWSLIDYLKNGRPESKSDCIFICHKAPYTGFSNYNGLNRMLARRMNKAGISMDGQKNGLHSLRSTLARQMLENGTPLPVISETLGHVSVQTTSIYLKIDLNGLKNCIIDPEEVFHG